MNMGLSGSKRTNSRAAAVVAARPTDSEHVVIMESGSSPAAPHTGAPPPPAAAPVPGVPVAEGVVISGEVRGDGLSLRASPEVGALSAGCVHAKVLAMLSVKAPSALDDLKAPRAPLDLVCCIDRSGSMNGQKMTLMKQTLELLVTKAGLRATDRVALVTFDHNVSVDLPLTVMDSAGHEQAQAVVRRLRPGGTTNLSGGALKAIDLLATDEHPGGARRTRSVLVFTDGQANVGISDPSQLVAAVCAALTAANGAGASPISVFTFGFGADHNEDMLREVAQAADGLYYYVDKVDAIQDAFADCLGGLVSVVAQNASVALSAVEGVGIGRVLGSTRRYGDGVVELGDLYSDDEKDLLIELDLPAISAPTGAAPVLHARLRAFNVVRGRMEEVRATVEIARPLTTPSDQPVNTALQDQRCRIDVANAMNAATSLADGGDVGGGREVLRRMRESLEGEPQTRMLEMLSHELEGLERRYADAECYRSAGAKMSKMAAMSHMAQRSTHANAEMYSAGQARKRAMKTAWMSK